MARAQSLFGVRGWSSAAWIGLLVLTGCGQSTQGQGQGGVPGGARVGAVAPVVVATVGREVGQSAAKNSALAANGAGGEAVAPGRTQDGAQERVAAPDTGTAAATAAAETGQSRNAAVVPQLTGGEPRRRCHSDAAVNAEVTLFALDPAGDPGEGGGFHNWRIVAQMPVVEAEQRKQVVYSAVRGCRPGPAPAPAHWNTTVAGGDLTLKAGFMPDRGLRVVREGRTVDYLISQDGSRVQVYENGGFARESAAPEDLCRLLESIAARGAAVSDMTGAGQR